MKSWDPPGFDKKAFRRFVKAAFKSNSRPKSAIFLSLGGVVSFLDWMNSQRRGGRKLTFDDLNISDNGDGTYTLHPCTTATPGKFREIAEADSGVIVGCA